MVKRRIRIRRNKGKKQTNIGLFDKRIKLPNNIRFGIIGLVFLLLMFSAFNINAANNKPETMEKITNTINYSQTTNFDYTVYLKNNTVYGGKTTLTPADNQVIFRNLVKNIQGTISYAVQSNEQIINTSGKYIITARLETDLWTKQYTLDQGDIKSYFTVDFPIDYRKYENITSTIDSETGVTATNPQLIIECKIYNVQIQTKDQTIRPSQITPSITISLNKKTVDISDTLRSTISGVKTEKEETTNQNVIDERNTWTSNSYLFLVIIIIFSIFTKSDTKDLSETQKQLKKIMKKYDEWIVEIQNTPKTPIGVETIKMRTFEDLMKISEETGKPVLYHITPDSNHTFHVIEDNIHYQYTLDKIDN